MSLRVLTLQRAPEGWAALLASDSDATAAHRPETWAALCAALPGMEWRFLAAEDEHGLAGGAAVVIERRAGLAWLHALPFLLPGAPLARAGMKPGVDEAIGGALAALQRSSRAAGGEWACYRASGEAMAAGALERPGGETTWLEAAVIELGGGIEEARRRMDRKTRQEISRGSSSAMRFAEDPDALDEAYALHVWQSRTWPAHRPMPLELSRRMVAAGVARVFTARDDGGLLCATLALDGGAETFAWWSGAHRRARAADAFARLMWWVAEWAAARGRQRLNLGASRDLAAVERFKRGLGASSVRYPVRWLDARYAPLAGRAAAALQRWVRRGRTRGSAS